MSRQTASITQPVGRTANTTVGEAFALALAAKDRDRLTNLLNDEVDFQALTPGRHWVAATAAKAVDEVMLRYWLRPDDEVLGVRDLTTGQVGDAQRVGYRLAVNRDGIDQVLEQQAYYVADGHRIGWIRILCSGYRPEPGTEPHLATTQHHQPREIHHA